MVCFGVKFDHWVSNVVFNPKLSDGPVTRATSGSDMGNSISSSELSEEANAFVPAARTSALGRELVESVADPRGW